MKIYKAQKGRPIDVVPNLSIAATETLPKAPWCDDFLYQRKCFYKDQAEEILRRLKASLPQGTMHELLVAMLNDKGNILAVR